MHPERWGEVDSEPWLAPYVDWVAGDTVWDRWYKCRDCGQHWRCEVRQSGHADIPFVMRVDAPPLA